MMKRPERTRASLVLGVRLRLGDARLRGSSRPLLLCALLARIVAACHDDGQHGGAGGAGGTAATVPTDAGGLGGSAFNQCGVAAPLPADPGRCTVVSAPAIADFDDYA